MFLVFLGFLGKNLRTHNLACVSRLVLACVSHCPKTLIFLFCLVLIMPSHACLFRFFSYAFMLSMPMFHMFNCLACYHILELGFV